MEEHKPKFVSRAVALGSNTKNFTSGPARSQWHGMDLLTTTPSTNRRAIYTPTNTPPPPLNSPSTSSSSLSPASGPVNHHPIKVKSDDAAMSARNLVIRRKLSERKRFDSADYAMKAMMSVMHAPGSDASNSNSTNPTSPPPPAVSPPQMPSTPVAIQSPRLSPSHARMGVSVFKGALTDGDFEMKSDTVDDEPMLEQHSTEQSIQQSTQQSIQQSPQPIAARYGAIGGAGMSAAGVMSARNIMIQKKMHEKRHFDSADWQLAQHGVQTDAAMDKQPISLQLKLTAEAIASPVNSPSAARVTTMQRNAQLYAQMSPSVRSTTNAAAGSDESKYAGLSGSNELVQRRLAEKKRFDSADYNMVQAARATPSSSSATSEAQLRRQTLLRQQQKSYGALQHQNLSSPSPPPSSNFFAGPGASISAPPAPVELTPLAVAADVAGGNSKYGKLCAANVLLRKKLKERKRFDSADYQMEQAKHHDASAVSQTQSTTPSDQDAGCSSPLLNPQAKHMKLSEGAPPSRWASHEAVVAMRPQVTCNPMREAGVAAPVSMEGRLAARSVVIHRHLAERRRFDSGDHFAAKEAASRGRRDRARLHG